MGRGGQAEEGSAMATWVGKLSKVKAAGKLDALQGAFSGAGVERD